MTPTAVAVHETKRRLARAVRSLDRISAAAKRVGELSAREREELVKALNAKDREIDAIRAENA